MSPDCYTGPIGYMDFVGGTLRRLHGFSHLYNTPNINALAAAPGFDMAICAAAPGSVLKANFDPERSHLRIISLIKSLNGLRTRSFILISLAADYSDQ